MSLTDDAHALIHQHFDNQTKKVAVDATCGNGHDTEFLLKLGFENVIGFDVQETAIKSTRQRLRNDDSVLLIKDSHANMANHIESKIDCLIFNFGYLPTGDKEMTTQPESSLLALQAGLELLSAHGLVSLMCYPGHPSGAQETHSIREWFATLDQQQWIIETHLAASPKPTAPILYVIKRR